MCAKAVNGSEQLSYWCSGKTCKNIFFVEHKRKAALGISIMKHNNASKEIEVIVKFQKQPPEVFYKNAVLKNLDTCLFEIDITKIDIK